MLFTWHRSQATYIANVVHVPSALGESHASDAACFQVRKSWASAIACVKQTIDKATESCESLM